MDSGSLVEEQYKEMEGVWASQCAFRGICGHVSLKEVLKYDHGFWC